MRVRFVALVIGLFALGLVGLGTAPVKACETCEVPVWGFGDATCELWIDSMEGTPSGYECPTCYCHQYSGDAEEIAMDDLQHQSCSDACSFAGNSGYGNGCDFNGPYDGSGTPSGGHFVDGRYVQDPSEWPVTYTLAWAEVEGYCECSSNEEGPPPTAVGPRERLPEPSVKQPRDVNGGDEFVGPVQTLQSLKPKVKLPVRAITPPGNKRVKRGG